MNHDEKMWRTLNREQRAWVVRLLKQDHAAVQEAFRRGRASAKLSDVFRKWFRMRPKVKELPEVVQVDPTAPPATLWPEAS